MRVGRGLRAFEKTTPTIDELLTKPIRELGLKLEGSPLERFVNQLYRELERKGVKRFRPLCYLSTEWGCPSGEPIIAIPFYLANPELAHLEAEMDDLEDARQIMMYLRHEAGHAFDHAYRLSRDDEWKEMFGSPRTKYQPYYYEVDPQSREFVTNVPDQYAQAHPVEDFAETFAVWLNPTSAWRERYAGRPALKKLRYVDRLMREVKTRPVPVRKPVIGPEARALQSTLLSYYERKLRLFPLGDPAATERALKRIFRVSRAAKLEDPASDFIRTHKRPLVDAISAWSGERRNQVARVVASLAQLCTTHRLVLRAPEDRTLVPFSTFATTLIVNRLRTHSYRVTGP